MKCVSCDKILHDFETTRKIEREDKSIYYPDLCNVCFKHSGLSSIANVIEREDLAHQEDLEEEGECIVYEE